MLLAYSGKVYKVTHLLQTPSHQHLRTRFPVLLRQSLETRLSQSLPSDEWAVGLHDDSSLFAPVHDIGSRQPWMEFPLADVDGSAFAFAVLSLEIVDVGF